MKIWGVAMCVSSSDVSSSLIDFDGYMLMDLLLRVSCVWCDLCTWGFEVSMRISYILKYWLICIRRNDWFDIAWDVEYIRKTL